MPDCPPAGNLLNLNEQIHLHATIARQPQMRVDVVDPAPRTTRHRLDLTGRVHH
jgi:hypothetical protein